MIEQSLPKVLIVTELGEIELELEIEKAPITVANFLKYVEASHYDNSSFYRTVKPDNQPDNLIKIEVIQGGAGFSQYMGEATNSPIALERTSQTGLRHKDGTLSMARMLPDSATSEFFICLGDQPELDFGGKRNPDGQGFAAFGRVVRGTEVVRQIQQLPAENQNLTPPIRISQIERLN